MSRVLPELFYDILGGESRQHTDRISQSRQLLEMTTASNVIPDPTGELVTSPGFSKVRSSAISGTPSITGIHHMGDLVDEVVLWASDGKPYRDNANPPGNIAGGTDFASGADVLARSVIFNNFLICVSRSRNVPQTFNASMTRADLGGTPPRGVDVKALSQRVIMFSPSDGTTTYRHLASFNSSDNNQAAWTNPYTTNALNFGKIGGKMNILGGEYFQDHVMAFSEDNAFPIYQTPNADIPLNYQNDILNEEGGGPVSIHSVVAADGKLFWISRNFDVKVMSYFGRPSSIGFPVQPFLRGLSDSRRNLIVGGFEPQYRLVVWCMSDGSDTQNKTALVYSLDMKQFFFRTISRNAFGQRIVSGEQRLIGGGYTGFFYNDFDSSTTGNLDDSTVAIDADIITPRMHLGMPSVIKQVPYVVVELDPIGSESVTVQFRLNDDTTWSTFAESPVVVSGTDVIRKYFFFSDPFERVQLRFRDANSGERFRLTKFGFPKPVALYALVA